MNDMVKDLKAEMIPEGIFREIAVEIGTENLMKVAEIVGGATFYWPKPESLLRPVRAARIREEFNGYNHVELSRKYDVTERWVRVLCGEGHAEGQFNLFEDDPNT